MISSVNSILLSFMRLSPGLRDLPVKSQRKMPLRYIFSVCNYAVYLQKQNKLRENAMAVISVTLLGSKRHILGAQSQNFKVSSPFFNLGKNSQSPAFSLISRRI